MESFVKRASQIGFVLHSKPRISEYNFKSRIDRNIRLQALRVNGRVDIAVTTGKLDFYVLYQKSFDKVIPVDDIIDDVLESLPFYSLIVGKSRIEA
jgi:hypothetical protein